MILIIIILAIATVMLGAWTASTAVESRQNVHRSMKAVQTYGGANVREQEMLETVADRVLAPVSETLVGLARRLTPAGYGEALKRKIVLAGSPPGFEVDRFLVAKVLAVAVAALSFVVVYGVLGLGGLLALISIAFISLLVFFGPDLVLQRRVDDRRKLIERRLPDTLDLLVISVEAGLGFEQALDRTASAVPGPLSDECRRMLQETRMGASQADALRALDERTQVEDLRTFILAMLQAENFGISIARILKTQADEIRLRRRQRAQEKAQRAPIKMLFPLVTCVFPAIFVVVLLPAMFEIVDALG